MYFISSICKVTLESWKAPISKIYYYYCYFIHFHFRSKTNALKNFCLYSLSFTFSLFFPFRRKTIQAPFNSAWSVKRLPAHSNTTAASGSGETRSFYMILKLIFPTLFHGNMVTLPKQPLKPIALALQFHWVNINNRSNLDSRNMSQVRTDSTFGYIVPRARIAVKSESNVMYSSQEWQHLCSAFVYLVQVVEHVSCSVAKVTAGLLGKGD